MIAGSVSRFAQQFSTLLLLNMKQSSHVIGATAKTKAHLAFRLGFVGSPADNDFAAAGVVTTRFDCWRGAEAFQNYLLIARLNKFVDIQ